MRSTDPLSGYHGNILTSPYSSKLQTSLAGQIDTCSAFDRLGLSVMPYISAWRTDQPGIWYEFVSDRFLTLFRCEPQRIAETFCRSIIDHRQYQQTDIYPDIEESILSKDDLEHQRNRLRQETAQEGVVEAIYKVMLPDNRQVWLKDWASVTHYQEDRICLSPGYLCDVSLEMSQKDYLGEMTVTVNRDKALLVEAERSAALGQICAKIYHEIRNPILSIGGLARRIVRKDGQQAHRFLDVIVREADRLENILSNLFNYTNDVSLQLQPTDLTGLAREVVDLLKSDLDRQQIKLNFSADPELPPIMIDRDQIHLALVHVLKNSLEAMVHGGRLSISICAQPNSAIITVRDTGAGIADGHTPRLTEPFFTTKVYGTGLGLSLAQKAIDLHLGSLQFSQPAAGGTEVIMQLPLAPEKCE